MTIALAGNANVGKSAIFNQLTGLEQTVGNWAGKTVELAEGYLSHHGKTVRIIDLPGTYSMSAYSIEETVARDFISRERPDAVVNVVDATALERNLALTLQLLDMDAPIAIALNMMDMAVKRGMDVDARKLSGLLGVPVVPVVATRGSGVHELVDGAFDAAERTGRARPAGYGPEVESRIAKLCAVLDKVELGYPRRWAAIKLLEGDDGIVEVARMANPGLVSAAKILSDELEGEHGEPAAVVVASERYAAAARIAAACQKFQRRPKPSLAERLDALAMHRFWGYVWAIGVSVLLIATVSLVGGWATALISGAFEGLNPGGGGFWAALAWNGAVVGFYSAIAVAFGFILPFYLILGLLEDFGYLPRLAYLMDRPCHLVGLHGKACMPLMLGLGCNVPACAGCRIMENKRDRYIATFLSTLVPCSARAVVVLGLVGVYLGFEWAVLIYILDFALIVGVGRLLNRLMPGSSAGLILEVPPYRAPSMKIVSRQAWARFRPFLATAVPLIVLGSVVIEGFYLAGYLGPVAELMSPVTVVWLGLPAFTGILLVLGTLRKEAALVLLSVVAGTTAIETVMTPLQMVVFAFVVMVYVPCVSTVAALVREVGWRSALGISAAEIGLAVLLGGLLYRVAGIFI
ncbi:MAG: ferrous iron transport protein B [Euryarchaeota archaeon]|nr:ferrous iron transport protein B [Euryarchaeota archaeon]